MPIVNLLVKPASSLCNMRCRYCFYEDEAANRTQASMGVMTRDTARRMIGQHWRQPARTAACRWLFRAGNPPWPDCRFSGILWPRPGGRTRTACRCPMPSRPMRWLWMRTGQSSWPETISWWAFLWTGTRPSTTNSGWMLPARVPGPGYSGIWPCCKGQGRTATCCAW